MATAIRLGAFQLRHMDRIPAHAALSESVELARAAGHGHAAGMVNAVLRKLTRTPPPRVPLVETTAALAQRLSHPGWLVARWQKHYGRAATIGLCEYDQQPPERGTLFASTEIASPDPNTPMLQQGVSLAQPMKGVLTPAEALPHMDDGSRLVAELAAAAQPAAQRIWDCCAAPGGKTLVLAARHPAAALLATDISPRRLAQLAERLKGLPNVRTKVADATHPPADEAPFDLILCDVPCSGTGTLGRNPELKSRLQPADLSRQTARQREILANALGCLAPGGKLLYSTCSLEPEENEQVVASVLAQSNGIVAEPLDAALATLNLAGAGLLREGHLRTVPGAGFRGDGFFAALLTRE